MCLNRTSVGLKRELGSGGVAALFWPQSNQRGIETFDPAWRIRSWPPSLNRTSVGLKPAFAAADHAFALAASIEPAWD